MPPFQKKQFSFATRGIDLNAPADMLRDGYFPYLMNVRRATVDSLEPRHGLGTGLVISGGSTLHSVRRLNDIDPGFVLGTPGAALQAEIVGVGTGVGSCSVDLLTSYGISDTPYSGNPLSIVTHKSADSQLRYAYVADSLRMRKFPVFGAVKAIGLPPPLAPPSPQLGYPAYVYMGLDAAVWGISGTASLKSIHTRLNPASRSISVIKFDSGSSGWASIVPIDNGVLSMDAITVGTIIVLNGTEPVMVRRVMSGSSDANQAYIEAIIYESGSTGTCAIHLSTPLTSIQQDVLIKVGSGGATEYARVLSVHPTHDGHTSFRCSLTGSHVGGGTVPVSVLPTFRAYVLNPGIVAGNSLYAVATQFVVATGTGAISAVNYINLSQMGVFSVPVRPDDYMGITLYASDPKLISEVKIYIGLDDDGLSFNKNYYIHVIRPSDLTQMVAGNQTEIDASRVAAQRDIIDELRTKRRGTLGLDYVEQSNYYDPEGNPLPPGSMTSGGGGDLPTGDNLNPSSFSWSVAEWKISEIYTLGFGYVGPDVSKTLRDAKEFKIEVIATGSVTVRVGDLYVRGGYGPDSTIIGRPRQYRYRGRDSSTGVVSNWSPVSFAAAHAQRDKVLVSLPQHPSAEADKLDVEILGGDLLGWHYAGSIANGAGVVFEDTYSDTDLANVSALSEGNTHYQLWPQLRPKVSGVAASIAGNLVSLGGGESVDTSMAPGTAIRLFKSSGEKDFTVHSLKSASKFYLTESAGANNGFVSWEIPNPLIMGQPMPILAGPFLGFYFGLGDSYNPSRLYYTNGNDPDSTQDTHWIEIENEILQNILVLEGRAILFSTKRAYSIEPSFTLLQSGGNLFTYREIPNSRGLWARWACCVADGEAIFLGEDGIYSTSGGSTELISGDLRPLFPKGTSLGVTTNGLAAIKMVEADAFRFRLAYAYRELYFDYLDSTGATRTLVNERNQSGEWLGWIPNSSTPGTAIHYGEEGSAVSSVLAGGYDGALYRMAAGQGESGGGFGIEIRTPDHNFGDARQNKHFGDTIIDYDSDGATISAVPGFNHRGELATPTTLSLSAGRRQTIIDLSSGLLQRGKDASLGLTATITTQRPEFYLYEFNFSERPDSTKLRANDYELKGPGVKWCRGVWILADTDSVEREVALEFTKDDGTVDVVVITGVTHNRMTERFYPLANGIYLIAARIHPTDSVDEWEYVDFRLEAEPAPPLSTQPTPWLGDPMHARFVQGILVDIDTGGAPVDLQIQVDQEIVQTTINASTNKGPVVADGRAQIGFSFDTPFITHLIRVIPLDPARIFDVKVIDEPEPEMVYMWWTQQTDFGSDKFKIFGDGSISLRSTANIVFEIIVDGTSYFPTFYDASTNTIGARRDLRFRCPALKGKSAEFKVYSSTSAGRVAIAQKGFQIAVKEWGSEGAWQMQSPIGADHFVKGAEI